jgi:hypothetical protein
MSAAITRLPKQDFIEWYHKVFVPTIQGKKNLGEAFLDAFFPQVQDPVLRNWTVDNSAFSIILSTYADTAPSKKGNTSMNTTNTNVLASLTTGLSAEDQKLFIGLIDTNLIDGNKEGVTKALAQIVAAEILKNAVDNQSGDAVEDYDTSLNDCVIPRLKGLLGDVADELTKILPEVAKYAVENFERIRAIEAFKIETGATLYVAGLSVGTISIGEQYQEGWFKVVIKWEDGSKDDEYDFSTEQLRDLMNDGRFHITKPEPIKLPKVELIRITMLPDNVVTFADGATLTLETVDIDSKTFDGKATLPDGSEPTQLTGAGVAFIAEFFAAHGDIVSQTKECECGHDHGDKQADDNAFAATVSGCIDEPAVATDEAKQ